FHIPAEKLLRFGTQRLINEFRNRIGLRAQPGRETAEIGEVFFFEPRGISAALLFDPRPKSLEQRVQRGQSAREHIRRIVLLTLLLRSGQFLEEGRVDLLAAIVMSTDIIQISAISQSVLRDDIDVAAVEFLICLWLLI